VVLAPHISEKASTATEKRNVYAFRVVNDANKLEVKSAIEHLFNTKVSAVRIVNVRPKNKQFKQMPGKKKGWKKAYVTLTSDQKLDIMGAQ
jgi:large subunit ribosomal protein L23